MPFTVCIYMKILEYNTGRYTLYPTYFTNSVSFVHSFSKTIILLFELQLYSVTNIFFSVCFILLHVFF